MRCRMYCYFYQIVCCYNTLRENNYQRVPSSINQAVAHGPLNPQCPPCHQSINSALGQPNAAARMRFYHAALFSPPLSTLQQAVRSGFLSTFPGLHLQTLRRHPPVSEATIKGHLNASVIIIVPLERVSQLQTMSSTLPPSNLLVPIMCMPIAS